jgi:Carboxypeptidase regulatory-like domain/TonB dependent receptor-like, beta-barrel
MHLIQRLGAVLIFPAALVAQSTYGTLLGTITDATGAIVPQASVSVTEVTTNITKSGTANEHGDYELPNLLPGSYEVSVSAPGFKNFVRRGVVLGPRSEVRVDVSLEVGATETKVEVSAAAPVITTETATVRDVQQSQQLEGLPMNLRGKSTSPLAAITTLPGVQVDASGNASIAGSHPFQNEFTVDGFSVTSPRNNGPTPEMFPSTEQIAEVKVTSQLASAEYGQVGDITFIGKTGTNRYHGSLFEYFQNDVLDATPTFANGKPKKRNNTFGGSLSGRVWLPKLYDGKDRTFFFVDYEGNRQRSATPVTNSVPTSALTSGNFSGLGTQLVNPFTGAPFAGGQIPSSMINPVSQKVLSTFYPAPNSPNASPVDVVNNFRLNAPQPITVDLYDIRIDQNLSRNQSLFVRWSSKNFSTQTPRNLGIPQDTLLDPKSVVVSYNYSIRANLLNEFRFGFNMQTTDNTYPRFPDGAKVISDLGLQQLGPFPKGSAYPDFEFQGSSGVTNVNGAREEVLREHKYQFADNLTWIHGRHTMKFGFDIRELRVADYESFIAADNFGDYIFNGRFTGNDFGDFLLGLPNYTEIVNAGPDFDGHVRAYGVFGQDSFKITPKLTIDYGVRYEYHPPFHDDSLQITNFDRATGATIVPNAKSLALATQPFLQSINACGLPTPNPTSYGLFPCSPVITAQEAGIPDTLRISDKLNILPRLSFAYRVTDKTVVRAGAGIYDQTLMGQVFYSLTGIHTSDYRAFPNSITNGIAAIQFPNTKSASAASIGPAGNASFGTANQIDLRDPYVSQWSFTVERELGAQTGLRLTYTGMRSVGLLVSPDLNQIRPQSTPYDPREKQYPNWGVIKTRDNGGTSFYGALETVLTHRFSGGVFLQSSYTWAKNLSSGEGDNPSSYQPENGPRIMNRYDLGANYGNVPFSRRHRWLTTATIDLPFGRGRKFGSNMNAFADAILGGWSTNNIIVLQTGPYLTPYYTGANDPSGTNASGRANGSQRPDRLPASACAGLSISAGQVLDSDCFFYGWPGPIGRFGNSGVGILIGPGTSLWNAGLAKSFPIGERARLRFEGTFTNLFNHPNLGTPNMVANSSSFGTISTVQSSEGAGARITQFALRLDF